MNRYGGLLIALPLVLAGCTGTGGTLGPCEGSSICPITIFEPFPGVFAAFPDKIRVKSNGTTTLLWTFADPSKFKFSSDTGTLQGDGIDLVDGNGTKDGFGPCFITNDSKQFAASARNGIYYRCEIRPNAKFEKRYRIRFRTKDGSPRSVDPTVESTGSSDEGTATDIAVVNVAVGDQARLPPLGQSAGIRVVWDAGAGNLFISGKSFITFKDDATNLPVDILACYIATDMTGESMVVVPPLQSRWYACLFDTNLSTVSLTYEATYTDSGGNIKVVASKVTRP